MTENVVDIDIKCKTLSVEKLIIDGVVYNPNITHQQFGYLYSNVNFPISDNIIFLYPNIISSSINVLNGNLVLGANSKYFIETKIENVKYENNIGNVSIQWYNGSHPIGNIINIKGIGDINPTYGYESFDFSFNTSFVTTLSLLITSYENIISINKLTVKIFTMTN